MDNDETRNNPETDPAETAEPAATAAATAQPAAEEQKKIPYEILEKIPQPGSVIHYKISVSREKMAEEMEEMLHELKDTVSIEGFRRGKAPRKLLEIRYGKEVREDAVKSIAANVGEQIIEADQLKLVTEGDLHSWTAEGDNPLEMVIEFEVQPEIDVTGYDSLDVEVEEQTLTDEMVERRLEQLRESNAQYKSAGEGARFNPGDGASFDYEVFDEKGNKLEKQSAMNLFERDPMSRLPKELSEKLPGLAVGESIEAQLQDTHQTRQGQSRTTNDTHRLTLREIKIKELPALDDDFAKDLGEFNTIDELRDRIRKDLQARADHLMREQALNKVHDKLIEANPFEPPRSIVAASTMSMVRERTQQLAYAGINIGNLDSSARQAYVDGTRQDAERLVRRDVLLASIARKENIEVGDADVEQALERMAENEGRRALAIRARLEREGRLDELKSDLMIDKVNDFLLTKTNIKKVAPAPKDEQSSETEDEG